MTSDLCIFAIACAINRKSRYGKGKKISIFGMAQSGLAHSNYMCECGLAMLCHCRPHR